MTTNDKDDNLSRDDVNDYHKGEINRGKKMKLNQKIVSNYT